MSNPWKNRDFKGPELCFLGGNELLSASDHTPMILKTHAEYKIVTKMVDKKKKQEEEHELTHNLIAKISISSYAVIQHYTMHGKH